MTSSRAVSPAVRRALLACAVACGVGLAGAGPARAQTGTQGLISCEQQRDLCVQGCRANQPWRPGTAPGDAVGPGSGTLGGRFGYPGG